MSDDRGEDAKVLCLHGKMMLCVLYRDDRNHHGLSPALLDAQPVGSRLAGWLGLVDIVMPAGALARYLQTPDGKLHVGFITPISQHFRLSCNRVLLSVDGIVFICLEQEAHVEDHHPVAHERRCGKIGKGQSQGYRNQARAP
jgi:cyclic pyranopterin phosphate synthase